MNHHVFRGNKSAFRLPLPVLRKMVLVLGGAEQQIQRARLRERKALGEPPHAVRRNELALNQKKQCHCVPLTLCMSTYLQATWRLKHPDIPHLRRLSYFL